MESVKIKVTAEFEIEIDDLDEFIKEEGCETKEELRILTKVNFRKDFLNELSIWNMETKKIEVDIV